jgi:uroporphyrinogen decarboxylase
MVLKLKMDEMPLFQKDQMTPIERWKAIRKGERVDRVPFNLFSFAFSGVNAGIRINDFYYDMKKMCDSSIKTIKQYHAQPFAFTGYPAIGPWELGGEFKWPTGEFAQCPSATPAVETEEEAWNLKLPDIEEFMTLGYMPRFLEVEKLLVDAGLPFSPPTYGPWTTAGNIVDIARLCKWTVKKPDLAHHVIRLATDLVIAVNKAFMKNCGPEFLVPMNSTASSANNIVSTKTFQEFIAPYDKEYHESILATGFPTIFLHICGEQNDNYPYYKVVTMGTHDIVSVSHEVDLEYAMKFYPGHIIFGNVEPALFQTGTPEEVYERCRITIEKGKNHKGGFILAPGCELPPFAKPLNVWMMAKACNDFGYYD